VLRWGTTGGQSSLLLATIPAAAKRHRKHPHSEGDAQQSSTHSCYDDLLVHGQCWHAAEPQTVPRGPSTSEKPGAVAALLCRLHSAACYIAIMTRKDTNECIVRSIQQAQCCVKRIQGSAHQSSSEPCACWSWHCKDSSQTWELF
jgi:hypothetical protein